MNNIPSNIVEIRDRIYGAALRAGRVPDSIKLMAVTKRVPPEKINEAIAAGVFLIGENRVQEARDKSPELRDVQCHLIGHLQANKVKYIFDLFDMFHAVDSIELAQEINRKAAAKGTKMDVLLQVNVSGELSKFGVSPDEVLEKMREMGRMRNLSVKGLMTIPPYSENPDDSRPFYRCLSELKNAVEEKHIEGIVMQELSMGMSNDFEVAVEEGATIVRVGSAIFGERN